MAAAIESLVHEAPESQVDATFGLLFLAVAMGAVGFQDRPHIALETHLAIFRACAEEDQRGRDEAGEENATKHTMSGGESGPNLSKIRWQVFIRTIKNLTARCAGFPSQPDP